MAKEKNPRVVANVFDNIEALQPGQRISLQQHLARLEQIRQARIQSLEKELAEQEKDNYPLHAITATKKELAAAKNPQLSLDKEGLLTVPIVRTPWFGFLKDYQRGNVSFANKAQRWVTAQLTSVQEAIAELQDKIIPAEEKEEFERSAKGLVDTVVNLDLIDLQQQLAFIEEDISNLSKEMDEEAQQASKPFMALQRRKAVVQLYLQLREQLDVAEESERALILANIELCVRVDLIDQEISDREVNGTGSALMNQLRNNFDRMVARIREKIALEKECKVVFGNPTEKESIESLTHLIRGEFKGFDDAAVLGLVYTLQQKMHYFHSEQIILNPDPSKYPKVSQENNQVVVKSGGKGTVIVTVYTDIAISEDGSTRTFRSDFRMNIADLKKAGAEQKAAPIKFIETRVLAPDLKTVFALFDEIDPNNLDAVLDFVENVFNPYMDKLVDFRANHDEGEDKLTLLLAKMQEEGLNKVGFAQLQKIHQAQKTLATNDENPRAQQLLLAGGGLKSFLQIAKEYKRTDFVKQLLDNQFEALDEVVMPGKRPRYNPIVSLEELKQKTENMNESELDEFESFLELWYETLKGEGKQANRDEYRKLFFDYTYGHLPQQYDDLETVLSLWSEIDPTDRKAVLVFVKNILNPYVDVLRNREGNRGKSLELILLAEAEARGLNTVRPSLIQAVFQTIQTLEDVSGEIGSNGNVTADGQLAYGLLQSGNLRHFSEMVLYHGRKEQSKLPELLRTIISFPRDGIITINELKAKTDNMTEEEFKDFEISLDILVQHFEKDLKFPTFNKKVEDFGSNADKKQEAERIRKYQEARDAHAANRLKHEAAVRNLYRKIVQLKFKDGIEGVVAARKKQAEIMKNISAIQENPTHKRYDQLADRHKALTQEKQALADSDRKLNVEDRTLEAEANKTRSRRGTILLGIATVLTVGLALIPVAISDYLRKQKINERRSEIAVSKEKIAAREAEIAKPLTTISMEMEHIRSTCNDGLYIARADEELEETLAAAEKLCEIEGGIVANIMSDRENSRVIIGIDESNFGDVLPMPAILNSPEAILVDPLALAHDDSEKSEIELPQVLGNPSDLPTPDKSQGPVIASQDSSDANEIQPTVSSKASTQQKETKTKSSKNRFAFLAAAFGEHTTEIKADLEESKLTSISTTSLPSSPRSRPVSEIVVSGNPYAVHSSAKSQQEEVAKLESKRKLVF